MEVLATHTVQSTRVLEPAGTDKKMEQAHEKNPNSAAEMLKCTLCWETWGERKFSFLPCLSSRT